MDRLTLKTWLRGRGSAVVIDLVINLLSPALLYVGLHARLGDVDALLAASVPPLVWSVWGLIANRRLDALSTLSLVGIALSLLAFVGGGSPRLLELREKIVTLLISLAFLGSAAIGKPLIFPLARATMARESREGAAAFDKRRNEAPVRHTVMVMTLAWGFGLLADFLVSLLLIFTLPIAAYLIVGPILGYGTIAGLGIWTILYRRHREGLADVIQQP